MVKQKCRFLAIGLVVLATNLLFAVWAQASAQADIVLRDGAVYTVDANRGWAEAVAITGGKISFVGTNEGAQDLIGEQTQIIDLAGKMVLPSFQDAHVHPPFGGAAYLSCNLHGMQTQEQIRAAFQKCVEDKPEASIIRGGGWLMSIFPNASPHKDLLDDIEPDRPVILDGADGHSVWVNSKTLEIAGITRDTPDPPDGRIDRDPVTGEPSGTLQENAAMLLVTSKMDPYSDDEIADGIRYAQEMFYRFGITAAHDVDIRLKSNLTYRSLEAYRTLRDNGELTLRTRGSLRWDPALGLEQIEAFKSARDNYSGGRFRATSVKFYVDGSIENQTAALLETYSDKPGYSGYLEVKYDRLVEAAIALDKEGFQLHFHVIGDAAVRAALDAIEAAREVNGARDSRPQLVHLVYADPEDIPRFKQLGVIANFQPLWAYADDYITELTLPRLGPQRGRWVYAINSFVKSGARVAFGSDWSVSSANPLEGIQVALTRQGPPDDFLDRDVFIPEERIELEDAIVSYTINAAYANFLDDVSGSIEVGKLADLIVLENNLFEIPVRDIGTTRVLLTLLDGESVHGSFDDFN